MRRWRTTKDENELGPHVTTSSTGSLAGEKKLYSTDRGERNPSKELAGDHAGDGLV